MPEVEAELKGVTDVPLLQGVLSWAEDKAVIADGRSSGPL